MAARHATEITDEMCDRARDLAIQGLNRREIAVSLRMGERTIYEKMAKFPKFLEAIEQGKALGIEQATNSLFKLAHSGNSRARDFALNNYALWTEKQKLEHKDLLIE